MKRPTPSRHTAAETWSKRDWSAWRLAKRCYTAGVLSGILLSALLPSVPDVTRWAMRELGWIAPVYAAEEIASPPVILQHPASDIFSNDDLEAIIRTQAKIEAMDGGKGRVNALRVDPALVEAFGEDLK